MRRATAPLAVEVTESDISIHALREEGDGLFTVPYEAVKIFLSTPSVRRATTT